ncbi:MAG: PfaD family polyunsaturated fatty acid/polyketide biosynthesis protein, partial [Myxococcota bacterium]
MTLWKPGGHRPAFTPTELTDAVRHFRQPVHVVRRDAQGPFGVALGGELLRDDEVNGAPTYPLVASLPALYPEWLGDRSFTEMHGLRFPYVAGAMANGIATSDLVIAMARAGMLGFFGAAGLTVPRISEGLDRIEAALAGTGLPFGSNLIHAPNEPRVEMGTVELYLKRGVKRVSASAYMGINPMVVRYAYSGIRRNPDGSIHRDNYVFAKISRPEVARRFLSPAPADLLQGLVEAGHLTADEAALARELPVAEDIIVEADSGGHTDNQTLTALFPTILRVRDDLAEQHGYARPIRIGAAGGIGTPSAVAAAFQLGAAFVLTGSVNQAAVESGLSPQGKRLLCSAGLADVVMAPAADMFELGVEVQVLQRGTMFGARAKRLYEVYRAHDGIEA